MTDTEPPPIPIRLDDRPTIGGLVVPWVTGRSPDDQHRFGAIDATRHRTAIHDRRCQICGGQLDRDRIVFAMREADLRRMVSPEAGMHMPPASTRRGARLRDRHDEGRMRP